MTVVLIEKAVQECTLTTSSIIDFLKFKLVQSLMKLLLLYLLLGLLYTTTTAAAAAAAAAATLSALLGGMQTPNRAYTSR
jgi:hypothetical protein